VSGVLIVGAAVLTYRHLDFSAALTQPDGPWVLVITGAVLVFSVVGLAWVQSSSDVARYQRVGSHGAPSMLWATFGATLPPFLLIAWGAMLAASSPQLAAGLATAPLATIAGLLPGWYPAPLLAAAALGLLSGTVLTIYSGGFAVQSLAQRLPRFGAVLIAAALVAVAAVVLVLLVTDTRTIVRDLATSLAVPVAAWAGIFAAEMMIRTRRFHAPSLLARGGIYPSVRWVNLIGLVVISAIGYGFVRSGEHLLGWQGYLFGPLGVAASDPFAASDIGVLIALVLGVLLPLATAVPLIRRQERAEAGTETLPT
ncbi:MAG TPA: hypothetical protein VN759_11755, partial [Pseudolysinimonas sp.]|nr:hypothetical protein [Pseudolysinimonas sp.]